MSESEVEAALTRLLGLIDRAEFEDAKEDIRRLTDQLRMWSADRVRAQGQLIFALLQRDACEREALAARSLLDKGGCPIDFAWLADGQQELMRRRTVYREARLHG